MSLCRHLLFRVNIAHPTSASLLHRRLYSAKVPSRQDVEDDSATQSDQLLHSEEAQTSTSAEAASATRNWQLSLRTLLPSASTSIFPKRAKPTLSSLGKPAPPEANNNGWDGSLTEVNTYEARRRQNIASVRNLPYEHFIRLAQGASKAGLPVVMDHIATDVVENVRDDPRERSGRTQILFAIVALHLRRPILSDDRLAAVMQLLENPEYYKKPIFGLAKTIFEDSVSHFIYKPSSLPSTDLLVPFLQKYLYNHSKRGPDVIAYQPSSGVQMLFYLTKQLLRNSQEQQAFSIFKLLASSNHIPPETLRDIGESSTDSRFIMVSALMKSALYWNWRRTAVDLCKWLLRSEKTPSPSTAELTIDLLYALLESPTGQDVSQCAFFIRELDRRASGHHLPDGLIRLFYASAHSVDEPGSAEYVYYHTQQPSVLERRQYPGPSGRSMTWFLKYLSSSGKAWLGRCLAKEAVDSFEPIPPQDRASFIGLVASQGNSRLTKALWERYAIGKDRDAVVGNASAMVRVVSVFAQATRRAQSRLDDMAVLESSGGRVEQLDRSVYEERLEETSSFANKVIAEYRQLRTPLAVAAHRELTSLARAYFLVGDVAAGFDAFRALLNRKELPDLHDLNVALSAMAEHSPRDAARMIDRMIAKGVHPDAITYGTVIHFATLHRDTRLISSLIQRAGNMGNVQLTVKSVQALIRASIAMENTSEETLKSNLKRTLGIIESLKHLRLEFSPNTGKYCVNAALVADDPKLAYDFWHLLVHHRVEWQDEQNKKLRWRIINSLRKHADAGNLESHQLMIRLSALGVGYHNGLPKSHINKTNS